jgi:hypothetical protein
MHLDEPWIVSIAAPMHCETLDADILAYLQKRFNLIRRLGGPDGYIHMWAKPSHGGLSAIITHPAGLRATP